MVGFVFFTSVISRTMPASPFGTSDPSGGHLSLRVDWDGMPLESRRRLVAAAIDRVVCRRAHLRGRAPADGRLLIFWKGGPRDDGPVEVGSAFAGDGE